MKRDFSLYKPMISPPLPKVEIKIPGPRQDEQHVRRMLHWHLLNPFRWRHDPEGMPDNSRALSVTAMVGRTMENVRR